MTVSLAFPEDNDPLSYDRLDGEWRQWHETTHPFEHKVPATKTMLEDITR